MTNGNLIIGAGGHGKVIADMMLRRGMKVLGFLDDNPAMIGQHVFNLPILGQSSQWTEFHVEGLVVGIGNNTNRRKIVQHLEQIASPPWVTVAHPTATLADSVRVASGTVIMAAAVISPDTAIGKHAIINTGAIIDHDCIIEDYVHVAPGVKLAGGVYVGVGALLGVGCCVIPGCRIGERAVIGAGATVVCDVPSGVIAKGVPARWDNQEHDIR